MAVDFGKLNRPGLGASSLGTRKTTGTSAQAAKNLANSSAATKSSFFSFKDARKANWVPGQNVTKGQNQYNYQGMRASLNGAGGARRSYAPSFTGPVGNYGMPNVKVNNDYANGMIAGQTIMAGIGLLNQLGALGGGDGVKSSSLGDKLGNALDNLGGTGNVSTFAGQLSNVDSFNNLNKLESEVKAKKANLKFDYQKLDPKTDMNGIIDGAKEGLELAGVNLDIDSLALSTLDSSDLDKCITSIEADIDKIGNFKTSKLPAAKNQITTKAGQIKGTISAKEVELSRLEATNENGCNAIAITNLKQQITELKKQQAELEKAENAIQQLSTECENTINDLEAKKAEVKDIKKFEDNIKDKKYDMAKAQDKELKQALDKLKKLDAEFAKASVDKNGDDYTKKDERREDKLNKLNAERAEVFGSMSKLISSLSAAGALKFENSKGSSYEIANLKVAQDYKPAAASS